jgi:hypothetical protein
MKTAQDLAAEQEKLEARLKDVKRKLTGQKRKDDTHGKAILGGLVVSLPDVAADDGKALLKVLANHPRLKKRDADFLGKWLPDEYAKFFQDAAKGIEAKGPKS